MKKSVRTLFAAALIVPLHVSSVSAALVWTIMQNGDDVIISTAGGSLDIINLTYTGDLTIAITGFRGDWARISSSGTLSIYNGFAIDNSLGSDVGEIFASSVSGTSYFFQDNVIGLPVGYVSGASLGAATITFNNKTLADLELAPGAYATWSWNGDSVTANVIEAIPEPGPVVLLGVGGLAGFALKLKRRKKAVSKLR